MVYAQGLARESGLGLNRGKLFLIIMAWVVVFAALPAIARHNYLLFHSSAEIFSIIIASGMFILVWNTRGHLDNYFLFFLGLSYLFIGGLDGLHLLAYKGMGVFPDSGANLSTQLWIAARYFESVSLLIAPSFLGRKVSHNLLFLSLAIVATLLLFSIFFWGIFPDCYLSGSGLTPFKIISEYVISAFLLTACLRIWLRKNQFERDVFILALISIALTACAEITFTAYLSVYGPANLIGHLLKIVSFYLLYRAIIVTGLKKPHALMFRDLDRKRQKLQEVNRQLTGEIAERAKVEQEKTELISELQQALSEIKTLRGILPMCSFCKKIRDDEGYWSQVEVYVSNHSEADFSHSVCPACLERHYKDYL